MPAPPPRPPPAPGACQGYNGTIFAYGQTASGKTHSVLGSDREPGALVLAAHDVFSHIHNSDGHEFLLRVSYLEIYNEEVKDLLAPPQQAAQQQLKIYVRAGTMVVWAGGRMG